MTKAIPSEIATEAAAAFTQTVDSLVMQKLTNLPSLGGVTLTSEGASNFVRNENQPEIGR